jgi:hypothetical protein
MLIRKLKTQENEGATSKYPEHTDIKVFGHIPEVFLALKIILFSDRSCFFSATVCFPYILLANGTKNQKIKKIKYCMVM